MFKRQTDNDKVNVLKAFVLAAVIASLVFAVLNFYRSHIYLAVLEVVLSVFSAFLFVLIHFKKEAINIKLWSLLYVLAFLFMLSFAFFSHQSSANIFIWVLVIPMVAYLLLGVKLGFVITAGFYMLSALLFYLRFRGDLVFAESVSYANVIFSSALLWILSHAYELSNQKAKEKLRDMAVIDHLTGLYNRTLLERLYRQNLVESIENEAKMGLVMFDLDYFKKINDTFGHSVGDQVLQTFSKILQTHSPKSASSFRIGGEEFVSLLPQMIESSVVGFADKIRKSIAATEWQMDNDLTVTVSVGIVTINDKDLALDDALKIADRRMYEAKEAGRDSVVSQDMG